MHPDSTRRPRCIETLLSARMQKVQDERCDIQLRICTSQRLANQWLICEKCERLWPSFEKLSKAITNCELYANLSFTHSDLNNRERTHWPRLRKQLVHTFFLQSLSGSSVTEESATPFKWVSRSSVPRRCRIASSILEELNGDLIAAPMK